MAFMFMRLLHQKNLKAQPNEYNKLEKYRTWGTLYKLFFY